jgi:hypothetical protein
MHQRRTLRLQAQPRWLHPHADLRQVFGLPEVPDRTTLARRSKDLYPVLQALMAFGGPSAEDLDAPCTSQALYPAKSLCKAQRPVWHQSDRQAGRIPDTLRHLDTAASWSKAAPTAGSTAMASTWAITGWAFPNRPSPRDHGQAKTMAVPQAGQCPDVLGVADLNRAGGHGGN